MAGSIIGTALSGHPSWAPRPITRPPRAGLGAAGSALLPKPPNVSAAGSAGLGAGVLSHPPAPPAGAPAAPPATPPAGAPAGAGPPDLSGSRWMGYLSPDQLNNLNQAGVTYRTGIGNWQSASGLQLDANGNPITDASGNPALNPAGTAEINYNQANAQAQYAHDVNQARAVEEMAARGLSVSGIRDSDLTDINRTLVDTQAQATATLDTLIGEATRAIAGLNASWNSSQALGMSQAAVNATPTVAPPAAPAAPAAPAPGMPPPPAVQPTLQGKTIQQWWGAGTPSSSFVKPPARGRGR